jgi:hypothetical protein
MVARLAQKVHQIGTGVAFDSYSPGQLESLPEYYSCSQPG